MMPAGSTWEYNANAVTYFAVWMFKGKEEEDVTEKQKNTSVGNVQTVQTLLFVFFLGILDF